MEPGDVTVLALCKEEERYVIMFRDSDKASALRQLGDWASNSALRFGWQDAAVLSQRVRQAGSDPDGDENGRQI